MHYFVLMKSKFQKIFNLLQGRVARNIYFWSIALIVDITTPSPLWLHIGGLIHNGLLITLVYFNNLVLIPRLITKRKFLAYFILVFVSIFLITFSETLSTKAIYHYHTYLHSPHPVIKISDNLSFSSVLQEMTSYFIEGVIYTFFFTLAWYMMNYSKQQRSIEAARKKQTEAELLFLKGQINPHFLFNTLNNLYGLSMEKSDSTPVAIHKLSSILRYLLYESNSAVVSFEMERDIMLSYIDLELLRLSNKDNLEFSITSDSVYNIPPLLWLHIGGLIHNGLLITLVYFR